MSLGPDGIRPAPYQLVPLTKLLLNGLRSILIADGVGVGKTISASYIASYVNIVVGKPTIVVCSPPLIPKWIEELRSKFSITTFPVRSEEELLTAKEESAYLSGKPAPAYVMSNSIMADVDVRRYPQPSCVIFDEVHTYRNRETRWFSAAVQLSSLAQSRVGLSATPINNSLEDLVSELSILLPEYSWDALHATVEELWTHDRSRITTPLVTRFTKDKLGIHFARRKVISKAVMYPSEYVDAAKRLVLQIRVKKERTSVYEEITYFRIAASSPYAFQKEIGLQLELASADPKLELLKQILNSQELLRWLIFCEFEETANYIEQNLTNWNTFKVTGTTPMFDRPSIIKSFRDTPKSVLIMTSVGSEGLDFQFCQGLINYDLHWNPMRLEQRIGRIDRIGQAKSEIIVFNIIVDGSIDERVIRVIRRKLGLIMGSVFATGEILGRLPRKSTPQTMFDHSAFVCELSETEQLVSALRYTEDLPSQDYEILPHILPTYCWPDTLKHGAAQSPYELLWLKDGDQTHEFSGRIIESANVFKRLVHYYS